MWTSTLEIQFLRVLPTQLLGRFWRGAYFTSFAPLQVKNLPRPQMASAQRSWVRVRNRLAGICGSDLHLVFVDGDLRIAPAALPTHKQSYPGHEVVGEVIEIGDQVQHLRVGDRVVLQSAPNCLSAGVQPPCRSCANGHTNVCENAHLPGPQQLGGGWSEEMLVHEQQLFRIPEEMEDEQAVLLEPTAVAVHAVLRHPPQAGEKVLIVGAGTIGLLTLQVVRALAPQAEISVLARHNFQVEQATRLGASHIIYERDTYESIREATGAKLYQGVLGNKMLLGGYHVIYDTIGTQRTVHDCLRWTSARGTVVLVGLSLHHMNLDLSPIWHQEVNLIGTTGHGMEYWPLGTQQQLPTFTLATNLITNGLLHPEKLITHRFAISNFREALQTAMHKKGSRAIKVVFDATLLPATAIPNARPAVRSRVSPALSDDASATSPRPNSSPLGLTPASQSAPSTGPSHFTMTQSEDFSADFDNTHFVTPKPRRPPSALQFRRTTDDIPVKVPQMGPTHATNAPPETLNKAGELEGNSTSQG